MSWKNLLVAIAIAVIIAIPISYISIKPISAQQVPDFAFDVTSGYPEPHEKTFWLFGGWTTTPPAWTGLSFPTHYMFLNRFLPFPVSDYQEGTITIEALNGFTGDIFFSALGVPPELSVSIFPNPLTVSDTDPNYPFYEVGILIEVIDLHIPLPDVFIITIEASGTDALTGTTITHSQDIVVFLQDYPDVLFRLKGYPYVIATVKGTTITVPLVAISRAGFDGAATFSLNWASIPTGVNAWFEGPLETSVGGNLTPHSFIEGKLKLEITYDAAYGDNPIEFLISTYRNKILNGGNYWWLESPNTDIPYWNKINPAASLVTSTIDGVDGNGWYINNVGLALSQTASIWQKFRMPLSAPSYILAFYFKINTEDTPGQDIVGFHIFNDTDIIASLAFPSVTFTNTWYFAVADIASLTYTICDVAYDPYNFETCAGAGGTVIASGTLFSTADPSGYLGEDIFIRFFVGSDGDIFETELFVDEIVFKGGFPVEEYLRDREPNIPSGFFSMNVKVQGIEVLLQEPVLPPDYIGGSVDHGGFEGYTVTGTSLPPADLTCGSTGPGCFTPYTSPSPSIPGVWSSHVSARFWFWSPGWRPNLYATFIGIVDSGTLSIYDSVYSGSFAARIGATPDHPFSGFRHTSGWEILRFGPITLPTLPGDLTLQFYMYTDSQEGSPSAADFWDPFFFTIRSDDTISNPISFNPFTSLNTDPTVLYYEQISSASSWQTWASYTFILPDTLKGATVWFSFEMFHRDTFFRTWHIIDEVRLGIGLALTDVTLLQGSMLEYKGFLKPTFTTGNYLGQVSVYSTVDRPGINVQALWNVTAITFNAVTNGDFELGDLTGWQIEEDVDDGIPNVVVVQNVDPTLPQPYDPNVISGRFSARFLYHDPDPPFGDLDPFVAGYTILYNPIPISIPSDISSATLTFKHMFSGPPAGFVFDWTLQIVDADTGIVLLDEFLGSPTFVQTETFDLTEFAGKNIILRFMYLEDGVDPKAVYLDDITLEIVGIEIGNIIDVVDPTVPFNWEAGIEIPPGLILSTSSLPPGNYSVRIIFEGEPLFSPAIEEPPPVPMDVIDINVRIISITTTLPPEERVVTSSSILEFPIIFEKADGLDLNITIEARDVWVSTSLDTFGAYDRSTSFSQAGLWIKYPNQNERVTTLELPGHGVVETTWSIITQNTEPGRYLLVFYASTPDFIGPGMIPPTLHIINPPPGTFLYREFIGAPFAIELTVGDYVLTTDSNTVTVPSTGSTTFEISVSAYVLGFDISFDYQVYEILLGEIRDAEGITLDFSPVILSIAPDETRIVTVTVTTEFALPGQYYIDIIASDGRASKIISGIKLFVLPVVGGGAGSQAELPANAEPLIEMISKKLPIYEYKTTVEKQPMFEELSEISKISIEKDKISKQELMVVQIPAIPVYAILIILSIIAAIGVGIFLIRRFI